LDRMTFHSYGQSVRSVKCTRNNGRCCFVRHCPYADLNFKVSFTLIFT